LRIVEDQPSDILKFAQITDRDSNWISVDISVNEGSISSSKSVRLQGEKNSVNQQVRSLTYTPEPNSNRNVRLQITVSDGAKRSSVSRNIQITPVNDAPVIKANNSNISFEDVDSQTLEVSIKTKFLSIPRTKDLSIKKINSDTTSIKGNISQINKLFANSIKLKNSATITAKDQSNQTSIYVKSLSENISEAIDKRIENKDASVAKPIFSSQNHESKTYIRNENCWAYDLDLTSISPWNSAGGQRLAGTLISPRHIIFATHYQIPIGATIRFITKDNVVVERKMTNKITPPYTSYYFPDISVGILDSDVPPTINFAKVLPDNWKDHIDIIKAPALVLDQEEKALISNVLHMKENVVFGRPTDNKRINFHEQIISGDSGNPSFLIINNQLVLLTIWTFSNSGTSITHYKKEINKMMESLGGNYKLSEIVMLNHLDKR
jgi:hypothetical protein